MRKIVPHSSIPYYPKVRKRLPGFSFEPALVMCCEAEVLLFRSPSTLNLHFVVQWKPESWNMNSLMPLE